MDLFKKDLSKGKGRKRHSTDGESEEENKLKRNKEFLDRHMKDNSFKMNSSAHKQENTELANKLYQLKESFNFLTLKVLNSSSNMNKGTSIKINCQGIINNETPGLRNGRDGIIYFGYYPDPTCKEYNTIDYNIPITKSPNDKSDNTNM